MLSKTKTIILEGMKGNLVEIQADVSSGLPSFDIVGLPDIRVKEAKERVKIAIKNSGVGFPSRKVLVNLAPADKRKEGTFFDLPIAIGILSAIEEIKTKENLEETIFLGELSLDGKINKINGVLPMCIEAAKLGIKKAIIPKENSMEASIVKEIEIIAVENLKEVVDFLNNKRKIHPLEIMENINFKNKKNFEIDFLDVKGQENAKRALEIAATGSHNCLLIGSPGAGKTMLSERVVTILPDLTFEESLEITKIHSISGKLDSSQGLITTRPFRKPHHTSSPISIIGGGRTPKPGEISMAHLGVLFLDELPEFNKNTLEVLRGPLEDGVVIISRLNLTTTYPANFMLIASMNPCPCGYYGTDDNKCHCTEKEIAKYMGRISGPLLDRIDLHIEVKPIEYKKIGLEKESEDSKTIKARVEKARKIQLKRYKELNIYSNSELTPKLINEFCKLDNESKQLMKKSFEKLGLSARAHNKILKVARTIADLDESKEIEFKHVAEAIQYRSLDRKYFK